ncbi:hypothetical protein C8A03DRAFT_17914 [Achaetomium macrosporum]|uniref:N-acetyltransferase ESCO zinc-finger domain-containing protein n=1 Tax=Achaetomium macrosporum TaxID=79813 RepID=A0AAN7C4R1_9PEZI|nr:hypothetical protein C8A03DRAFT_17914 [Achaetomium macrosporum]
MDRATTSIEQPTTAAGYGSAETITPQSRKRPLRTYSRRSAPAKEHDVESSPKRGRNMTGTTPDLTRAESPQLPLCPRQDQAKGPNPGSILAYFKPLPPNSDDTSIGLAPCDPAVPHPTPPTSPLPPSRPRKRRRLTTRPHLSTLDQRVTDGAGDCIQLDKEIAEESRASKSRSSSIGSTIVVGGDSDDTLRPPLGSVAVNTLQTQPVPVSDLEDGKPKTKKRPERKKPAKDMTQTTLSLSIHKEPGFTICGVCDILYNPLNEKDRKEHSRRHAAYSRRKKKVDS